MFFGLVLNPFCFAVGHHLFMARVPIGQRQIRISFQMLGLEALATGGNPAHRGVAVQLPKRVQHARTRAAFGVECCDRSPDNAGDTVFEVLAIGFKRIGHDTLPLFVPSMKRFTVRSS